MRSLPPALPPAPPDRGGARGGGRGRGTHMKHLVWTAAAVGAVLTSSAFADVSITAAARAEATIFGYESPSRSKRPGSDGYDNGNMYWSKDIRHKDDVAINAKSDNAGITIKLSVEGNTEKTGNGAGGVTITSYQMWANFFGIRLDAGDYDQRLAKNLNNDTKFKNNYSGHNKPGIWKNIDGKGWGKDAANITMLEGAKTAMNFQVSKSGLLDNKLTVRGVLFTYKDGTDINGDNHGSGLTNNEKWIFTPFALGGEYKLDNSTQVYFNAKLSSITHNAKKANIGQKIEADNSVWTLNGNIYKKLDSGMEVEAHYTLGASLYSNWSGHGAHAGKQFDFFSDKLNGLVRDFDVFAHGVDFRVKKGLSDALSMTLVTNLTYVQSTEMERRANRHYSGSNGTKYFKDSRAKSYYTGAAGTLAYYAALSVDYKQSDMITYQLQTNLKNENVFQTAEKKVGDYTYVGLDYYKGIEWNIRPAVIIKPDSKATVSAGVNFKLNGFQQNATGSDNTFKTTMTVPINFRVQI